MNRLGKIQISILKELRDDDIERSILVGEIRRSLYNDDTPKCISLRRIRLAINSLKQKNIITEEFGILSRNK
jgi:hypothetical protein